MEYAIETKNLGKKFNHFTALDGISLQIEKGDIIGYVGPNGAGKTTTIKILTTLIKPTSGFAYINGVDVKKRALDTLKDIGALIEVPGIYDYLTPNEILTYFGKVYRMSNNQINKRIKETLGLVRLSDWEHKKIGSFSTGMQRRLAIAKAIFHSPNVLILDEPVLGLDPKGIRDIRELIRYFNKDGMTIFLSSHLLSEVAEVCNKVIFLDKGRVTAFKDIKDIINEKKSTEIMVRLLKSLSEEEINKLSSIEIIEDVKASNDTLHISFDGEPDTSYQILAKMISLGYKIVSYNIEVTELEDYYISIMGDEKGVK
jgi:ABC-2 type transport system ATP-binding protein